MQNKWKYVWLLSVLCMTLLLAGCTEKAPEALLMENIQNGEDGSMETVYVREDGSVQASYVEDFEKSYYDLDELRTFMKEMIAEYNEIKGAGSVELTDLSVSEKKVYAILTYSSVAVYADFNNDEKSSDVCAGTEAGTASAMALAEEIDVEAAKERYGSASFLYAKKASSGLGDEILDEKKQKVLVLRTPMRLWTASDILYYTGGKLIDSRTFEMEENAKEAVIVYKK